MPASYTYKQNKKPAKRRLPSVKKTLIIAGGIVIAAALILAILEKTGTTHLFSSDTPVTPTTPDIIPNSTNSDTGGGYTPDKGSGSDTPAPAPSPGTSAALLAPTGNFVSNHHPNLSGSPAPSSGESSCTTTPGASCNITFTKDGVTKSLGAKSTDKDGNAYWTWTLQSIGLTEGTWKINAVASSNGQEKATPDALDMVVAQ